MLLIEMPRKNKRKGLNKIQRQLSTPTKSSTKKKKLPHSSHSATELTQFNEEAEFNNTPPAGNSRPTSPINFILPLLENGFSWPRRKSPFKSSQNDKNVRSPLLSSPDSGYPSSPTQDDCYLGTSNEEKEEKQIIKLVPREPCISPLSDEENKRISNDIEDIIASLDDAINEDTSEDDILENGKIDVSEDDGKIDASSDDGKIDLSSDEGRIDASSDDGKIDASSDDCELYNGDDKDKGIEDKKDYMNDINNTKVKDNKGTISKKVRFKLNHPPLRKCKRIEEYPNDISTDPHEWEVTVRKVDIRKLHDNEEASECVVLETFKIMVCHHPECTENNGDKPLLMCRECDKSIHGSPDYSGHLVLDAPKKKISAQSSLARGTSTPNLPVNNSDTELPDGDDEGVDTEDCTDGIYMKKADAPDFKPPATPTAHELKLKRKKAYKLKRRHTDEGHVSGTNVNYYDASDDADSDQGDDVAPKRAQQNCNAHTDTLSSIRRYSKRNAQKGASHT
ncbi:hypothetical protein KUTeg_001549 [Tegillarca granosa]|uniref:Uncharacterized protein n=1 Tax=Tegillarca granosa TaxID=220873 RepID=A0ABQ9FVE0_TEGGR|nr:hypothetical protein KUTeg_001549 [Tegillarca granosa]